MNKIHAILAGPFFFALLGTTFCVWRALGNDINVCVTAGCILYQDVTVAGISFWWFGVAAFGVLAGLSLLGVAAWGRILAALALAGDICLLLLMAVTSPCISCLVVALLFALVYFLLRRIPAPQSRMRVEKRRPSLLLWVWLALFVVNLGTVVRSQADVWPILDESGNATTRLFFSPSCRYCIEAINTLSGKVDVAFYPLAETEADVWKIARMRALLDEEGLNIAQAVAQSQNVTVPSDLSGWRPGMLLLRFRMLRNKAHIFAAGSQGVPFFEQRGLPGDIRDRVEHPQQSRSPVDAAGKNTSLPAGNAAPTENEVRDERLPLDTGDALSGTVSDSGGNFQCGGARPCPPGVKGR